MDTIIQELINYRYVALTIGAFLEGPLVSFAGGVVAALGYLNLYLAFLILFLKDFVFDTILWGVGRFGVEIPFFSRMITKVRAGTGLGERLITQTEYEWREHPARLMWVGKIAWGLSAWFMISAGMSRVPLYLFWIYSVPVTAVQYGTLMLMGYFLGTNSSEETFWVFRLIQWSLAGAIVFLSIRFIGKYVKEKYSSEKE